MSQTWIQIKAQITDTDLPLQGHDLLVRVPIHARGSLGIPTIDVRLDERWVPLQLALGEIADHALGD